MHKADIRTKFYLTERVLPAFILQLTVWVSESRTNESDTFMAIGRYATMTIHSDINLDRQGEVEAELRIKSSH